MTERPHRGTIFVHDAEVVEQREYPGSQFILTVNAPECARTAGPGSFAHISCDPGLPMRRPLSIMTADPESGELVFLYKIVGEGLTLLSQKNKGDRVSVLGPIGREFWPVPGRGHALLIGGGVGIPPMVFLADRLRKAADAERRPLVLMGSELPFPFELKPSGIDVPGIPASADQGLAMMESWGVPSRLASLAGFDGCHHGYVTDLAREWLATLGPRELDDVAVFACGPTPMLAATAALAADFGLPCQVSLEEFMACAVGGCAGCAVPVRTDQGVAMKRVCVDGPVFEAGSVFPPAA